jgi:metal-responsive CopG/Arc/MetJ family transcriptional regulator
MGRIESMTGGRKLKISISLDADLLDTVDRRAEREKTTRSAIMEQWLRSASRQAELQRLEEETAAYYDSLTPSEKAEDAEWVEFASRSARKLTIDEPNTRHKRRARRS